VVLYLDSARFVMSLTAKENDIAIPDLPKFVDVYIRLNF
jgi:hypothetical protein